MCSAFALCVCVCVCRSKKQDRGRDRVKDRHRICTLIPFYKVMLGEILPGSLTFLYIFETEAQTFFLDYYFKGVSIENSWLSALPLEPRADFFFLLFVLFSLFLLLLFLSLSLSLQSSIIKTCFPLVKIRHAFYLL